jgi:hypothetical protein
VAAESVGAGIPNSAKGYGVRRIDAGHNGSQSGDFEGADFRNRIECENALLLSIFAPAMVSTRRFHLAGLKQTAPVVLWLGVIDGVSSTSPMRRSNRLNSYSATSKVWCRSGAKVGN